jgi:putative IMPACT (imprinted ancient) family translation regulator
MLNCNLFNKVHFVIVKMIKLVSDQYQILTLNHNNIEKARWSVFYENYRKTNIKFPIRLSHKHFAL